MSCTRTVLFVAGLGFTLGFGCTESENPVGLRAPRLFDASGGESTGPTPPNQRDASVDGGPGEFDPLDVNRDGSLTPDDLASGQAAIHLRYTPPNGEPPFDIRHTTEDSRIYHDEQGLMCPRGWGLKVGVDDPRVAQPFAVFVWFQDTDRTVQEMSVGQGEIFVMSVDIPAIEHGGTVDGPLSSPMTIAESDGVTASGWVQPKAEVEVRFYSPDALPSGERFLIHDIAFHAIEARVPHHDSEECVPEPPKPPLDAGPCSEGWGPTDSPEPPCLAIFEGRCFESTECACALCGSRECLALQSLPALVSCQ